MMTHVTLGHHPESAARQKRPYRVRAAKVRLHSLSFIHFPSFISLQSLPFSHFPSFTFLQSLSFIHFAAAAGPESAAPQMLGGDSLARQQADGSLVDIVLPPGWFPSVATEGTAVCRAAPAGATRSFGAFTEKTLRCNTAAKDAIDNVCGEGGFTQAWAAQSAAEAEQGMYTMTKIPAIILVKLMLGLPEEQEHVVRSLIGAYSICMDPDGKTAAELLLPPSLSSFATACCLGF